MLTTKVNTLLYTIVLYGVCCVFYILNHGTFNNYSIITDYYTRVFVNEFYFNTWYYWWTNFYFIHIFILFILIQLVAWGGYVLHLRSVDRCVMLITLLVVFLTKWALWNLNTTTTTVHYLNTSYNSLLFNSINEYHPLILYTSLVLLLPAIYSRWGKLRQLQLLIIVGALFLGSWWAFQEGSWGEWWNWDASEVFGYCILITVLLKIHRRNYYNKHITSLNSIKIIGLVILNLYLFLQINFTQISHNFTPPATTTVPTNLVYLLLFITVTVLIFALLRRFIKDICGEYVLYRSIYYTPNPLVNVLVFVIYIYLFFIILVSNYPLIHDLMWQTTSILVKIPKPEFENVLVFLFLIITLDYTMWNTVTTPLLIVYISVSNYGIIGLPVLVCLVFFKLTPLNITHKLSFYFIMYTQLLTSTSGVSWTINDLFYNPYIQLSTTLGNTALGLSLNQTANYVETSTSSLYLSDTTPSTTLFDLKIYDTGSFLQHPTSCNCSQFFGTLNTYSDTIIILNTVTFLLFIVYYLVYQKKQIIF